MLSLPAFAAGSKRVFAKRWSEMDDDDSLGEVPSFKSAVKHSSAVTTAASAQPAAAPAASDVSAAASSTADSDRQAGSSLPAPAVLAPTSSSPPAAASSSAPSLSLPSPAPRSAAVVFQCRPKAQFKSWTELSATSSCSIKAVSSGSQASDPMRVVLSFGPPCSDDESSAAAMEAEHRPAAAAASSAFDPELDNSRDGLPLLLRLTTVGSSGARLENVTEVGDTADAVMDGSRDRGVKRKEAASDSRSSAAVYQQEQQQTVAAPATPNSQSEQTVAMRLSVAAVPAKEESAAKKPRLSVLASPATAAAAFVAPVVKRVTRSQWRRLKGDQAAEQQPAASAANTPPPPPSSLPPVHKQTKKPHSQQPQQPQAAASCAAGSDAAPTAAAASAASASSSSPLPPAPLSPRSFQYRVNQRHKQVELGKRTVGYARYLHSVARHQRSLQQPRTPDAMIACSKRNWDGQIRKWRRALHLWDGDGDGEETQHRPADEQQHSDVSSESSGRDAEHEAEQEADSELGSELAQSGAAEERSCGQSEEEESQGRAAVVA